MAAMLAAFDRSNALGEQMIKKLGFMGSAIAILAVSAAPAMAQFDTAIRTSKSTVSAAKASQQRIESLDDQASQLLGDYRANLKQFELLERFNKSRTVEVGRQTVEIENLQKDVDNVENLQKAMQPLMEDMLNTLEDFVAADIPFLEGERSGRIARLRDVLGDSNYSPAQRYRLVVEAYQIENEYGGTVEAYEGKIAAEGGELAVQFLRVGRIALMYKTADDSVLRIYNRDAGGFIDLDKSYLADVRLGLRMAKEQTAPDLFGLPITAPVAAN